MNGEELSNQNKLIGIIVFSLCIILVSMLVFKEDMPEREEFSLISTNISKLSTDNARLNRERLEVPFEVYYQESI
jgi:hypothetical protein